MPFFLMFYISCQLTSETTEDLELLIVTFFFFLMKGVKRLATHLDKERVFRMVVKSGYQTGRENLPIWQGQQRKEMKQHRATRTPIVQ